MENENKNNYTKRPLWQWVIIYIVAGAVIYALIYYIFILNKESNDLPLTQDNNQISPGELENGVVEGEKALDLSGSGLNKIPDSVFDQTDLEELDVSDNNLTGAIQAEIRKLSNLRVLIASNNLMTGVPAEIGQLQKLEILDLSNNKLTGLPNELGNLKNLEMLDLSGNDYSEADLNYIRSKLPSSTTIITD